ncbi:MAG: hypothetical protein KDB33_14365, partial [Acidimicrobiales bacterium]|nr:hypothetical protein [Acidimicrobiales bacterium]
MDDDVAGLGRRRFLGRAAVGIGVAWAAPVVLSSPAAAQASAGAGLVAVGVDGARTWTSDAGANWASATTPISGAGAAVATDGAG